MKRKIGMKLILAMTLLSLTPVIGCAADGGRRQGPPPEAIKACKDKAVGDAVSFTGPRGESLAGTCKKINDQLVAVPEGMDPEKGPKR